jgi:hypothetical protein
VELISSFIPRTCIKTIIETASLRTEEESRIFEEQIKEIFYSLGRIPHYLRLMAQFPAYLSKHSECMHELFFESGTLPQHVRFYIAYMVRFR